MDVENEKKTDIYKCLWLDHGSWIINRDKILGGGTSFYLIVTSIKK